MHVSIVLPCIYNGIQSDFEQHNTQHCMNGEADHSRMYVYMHLAFKELTRSSSSPSPLPPWWAVTGVTTLSAGDKAEGCANILLVVGVVTVRCYNAYI